MTVILEICIGGITNPTGCEGCPHSSLPICPKPPFSTDTGSNPFESIKNSEQNKPPNSSPAPSQPQPSDIPPYSH